MRVVHVSFHIDPRGRAPEDLVTEWPTLTDVAAAAQANGVRVDVLQAAAHDAVIEQNGVACQFIRERRCRVAGRLLGQSSPALGGRLASRVRELQPSLVHIHGLAFSPQIRLLQRRLPGVPVLIQDHADRPPRFFRRTVHRWGLQNIDAVAFTAESQVIPFIEAGVLRSDVRVFEVTESSSRFVPDDQDRARELTGLQGDPCLLWLGHLDANKDPLTVLDALSQAVPALKDPQLWCFFRQAPLRHIVERRIRDDPRLAGRVHLMGPVAHARVEELLSAADFLVQGSHREGSGYAVIEALACGTIPVVTDIPSFRRLTGGGKVGGLVPVGDSAVMARTIIEWAARDKRQARLSARTHFDDHLSFEALGRDLRTAYRALAGAT